ncbi:MAG: hypothetical protein M1821_002515 [Bathelium mastoideum]|nr:MAG: hypothetical protein M1821_002515 [Bathelium mastoideum]
MDRRLPYRRGMPLLKPLPLKTALVDELAPVGRDAQSRLTIEIAKILRECHVFWKSYSAYFARRYHPRDTGPESQDVVFFVEGDLEESSIENWERAVQSIRKLLDESNLQHVFVEIIDYQKHATSSFAITEELFPFDKVESLYTSAQLYLMNATMRWTTMTLLNRGTNSSNLCPTLLITAVDLERDQWWTVILPELQKMCHSLSSDLDVELLHGTVSYTYGEREYHPGAMNYGQNLQMGDSVGVAGSSGSGSIGAAIELRSGDDPPTIFILSNHHVVAKDQNSEGSGDNYAIRSPSDSDTTSQRAKINEQINSFTRKRDEVIFRHGAASDFARNIAGQITDCQQQLVKISADDNARNAGNLSSSRQGLSRNGWIVDWSLTKLGNNRSLGNDVPVAIVAAKTSRDLQKSTNWRVAKLTSWCETKFPGRRVVKRGRTTGWTVGIVNMYNSIVMDNIRKFSDPTRNPNTQGVNGKAWPIFPAALLSDSIPFMDDGDSGSIIIQTENDDSTEGEVGVMIGLGFGAINDYGLMSPLSAIFADIEEQVNGVIIEPRKAVL